MRTPRRVTDRGTLFPEPIYSLSLKGRGVEKKKGKTRRVSEGLQNTRAFTFFDNGMLIRRWVIASNIKYAPKRTLSREN